MQSRTTHTTVTFSGPFVLSGIDGELPAGSYEVETDEELLEGVSFPAYRRKSTIIHLRGTPGESILTRTLTVDPNELDAAIERDRAAASTGSEIEQSPPSVLAKSERHMADRQDLDRADDEGMTGRGDRESDAPMGPAEPAFAAGATDEMGQHGITRVPVDQFHYREFRYTNLADAVAQARRDQDVGQDRDVAESVCS